MGVIEWLRREVSGDAEGGWIVDLHDGDNSGTYQPEAATADEALAKAEAAHVAKFGGELPAAATNDNPEPAPPAA